MNAFHRHTFVCLDCMEVQRRGMVDARQNEYQLNCTCSKCNRSMMLLSYRIRVPRKSKKKWDEFRLFLMENEHYRKRYAEIVGDGHELR